MQIFFFFFLSICWNRSWRKFLPSIIRDPREQPAMLAGNWVFLISLQPFHITGKIFNAQCNITESLAEVEVQTCAYFTFKFLKQPTSVALNYMLKWFPSVTDLVILLVSDKNRGMKRWITNNCWAWEHQRWFMINVYLNSDSIASPSKNSWSLLTVFTSMGNCISVNKEVESEIWAVIAKPFDFATYLSQVKWHYFYFYSCTSMQTSFQQVRISSLGEVRE